MFAQRNDPGNSDGIRNVSGNNTLSGAITITTGGSYARIRSEADLLTISGAISTNATSTRNLYLQGAGNGLISGSISDNSANVAGKISLLKEGTGTWTLGGNNTFTGGVTIQAGELKLNHVGALNGNVGSENGVAFGAASTGTLTLNGKSVVIKSLDSNATPGTPVVQNTSATPATLTIGNAANSNSSFAGTIQDGLGGGTLSVVKTGTATLTLSGTNTYGGLTTVSNGTLRLASSSALGSTANGTVVASGATLDSLTTLTVTGEALTLSGSGGAIVGALHVGGSKTLTWDGPLTLAANALVKADGGASFSLTTAGTINLGSNALTVQLDGSTVSSFNGNISDVGGSLIKENNSTLRLTGNNTYTGGTMITTGTLQVGNGGATGSLGSGAVVNNAALVVNRTGTLTTAAIDGTGTTTVTAAGANLTANRVRQTGLNIGAGNKVTVATNGQNSGVSQLTNLSINATGKLDLKDNDLVVKSGSLTTSQVATLVNAGAFGTVAGITSSLPSVATGVTGLGTGQIGNTAWAGTGAYGGLVVADTDTLVKYTYLGDADLDGTVTFDDYLTWQSNFGSVNTTWTSGHFQYDNGPVSFDDFLAWQTNFGLTIPDGLGLSADESNINAVPEPSSWILGSLAMLGLVSFDLRRRLAD